MPLTLWRHLCESRSVCCVVLRANLHEKAGCTVLTAADEPASGLGGCGPCTLESPFCLFNVFCTVELVRSTTMKGAGDAVAAGVEIVPLALVCPGKIVKAHVLGGLFWQGSEFCCSQG